MLWMCNGTYTQSITSPQGSCMAEAMPTLTPRAPCPHRVAPPLAPRPSPYQEGISGPPPVSNWLHALLLALIHTDDGDTWLLSNKMTPKVGVRNQGGLCGRWYRVCDVCVCLRVSVNVCLCARGMCARTSPGARVR